MDLQKLDSWLYGCLQHMKFASHYMWRLRKAPKTFIDEKYICKKGGNMKGKSQDLADQILETRTHAISSLHYLPQQNQEEDQGWSSQPTYLSYLHKEGNKREQIFRISISIIATERKINDIVQVFTAWD